MRHAIRMKMTRYCASLLISSHWRISHLTQRILIAPRETSQSNQDKDDSFLTFQCLRPLSALRITPHCCAIKLPMTINTSIPRLRVAIIGGGPGGLATAIALQQIPNIEVKIYEQASVLREVGAGISIGQNTWHVLELLGVADSLTSGHRGSGILQL